MSERVTWLLSVKDGMPYLSEALASIAAQTYPNWEVIAWVNGSTDGTLEELRRWIPARLPGRIIADQPGTYGAAMAQMTLGADTDLCAIMHADDINAPDRLTQQVAFLEAHPEVAVVGGGYDLIGAAGEMLAEAGQPLVAHDDIVHHMLLNTAIGCPTALFRRSAVLEVGNHRDIALVEDYDLWLRLAVNHKLANVPETVLHYRTHARSATQIAVAANRVVPAADACFLEHAHALYGCQLTDARLLRARRHPFALPALIGIARHLSRTQGGTAGGRFFSASFVAAARALVRCGDRLSWAVLAVLTYHGTPPGALLALIRRRIFRSAAVKPAPTAVFPPATSGPDALP